MAGGDWNLAVSTLEPLTRDPARRGQVEPILASSRLALQAEEAKRRALTQAHARGQKAAPAAPRHQAAVAPLSVRRASGETVQTFPGEISLGGSQNFRVKELEAGRGYRFRAVGKCWRVAPKAVWRNGHRLRIGHAPDPSDIFGLDFRVQFGSAPSCPLYAGQKGQADENSVGFIAEAAEVSIRVWDDGKVDSDVRCTFSDFAVRVE